MKLEFDRAHHRQIGRHKCRPGETARLARGGATGEVHRWQVLADAVEKVVLAGSWWPVAVAIIVLSSVDRLRLEALS